MIQKRLLHWLSWRKALRRDPRFILLLTEQGISLFFFSTAHQPSLIRLTQASLETPVGHFLSFLKEGPGIPIDIFHDMPTQMLKVEKIPPNLYALDPYRWVRHKRRSLMEDASFSGSYWYPSKKSKNKTILFAFFQVCSALAPLFQQLEQLSNPLQGVYALALEQVEAYHQLYLSLNPSPTDWLLGIHFEKNGRMRHTVIHQGRFILSRLFPPLSPSQTPLSQEEHKIREIQGTLRYIMKQFSTPAFDIQVLFWNDEMPSHLLNTITDQEHWVLSPAQSACLLNLPAPSPDFEVFFLTWFYTHQPSAFLCLKPKARFGKNISKPFNQKHGLLAWGLSLSLCASSMIFFLQAQQQQQNIRFLRKQAAVLDAQQTALNHEMSAFPFSIERARQFLALQHDLESTADIPLNIFEKLSAVLGTQLRLRHLDWQAEASEGVSHTLTLESYPVSPTLSQKQLIHLFDGFLERLKEHFPQSTLDVLHGPYNTHQTQLLTGGIHEETLSPDPTCVVKVLW